MHCNGNRLSSISAGLLVKKSHNPNNNSFHEVTLHFYLNILENLDNLSIFCIFKIHKMLFANQPLY